MNVAERFGPVLCARCYWMAAQSRLKDHLVHNTKVPFLVQKKIRFAQSVVVPVTVTSFC